MNSPMLSVVMPVYNAERFVAEAIESILNQTFNDFEFVIINDGSTDHSLEIIRSFKDTRIKLINNFKNIGNYPSRNKGHKLARGKYICVMDADDISLPDRLEVQYTFMEENPQVGIAGSCIKYLNTDQSIFREPDYEIIKVKLLTNNFICHPSIIMRHSLLKEFNLLYDEDFWYAGDYDLMVRASSFFPVVNMNKTLLHYRWSDQQLSSSMNKYKPERKKIVLQQINNFGIISTVEEQDLHLQFIYSIPVANEQVSELLHWLRKLMHANEQIKYYKQEYLNDFFNCLLQKQPIYNDEKIQTVPPLKDKKIDLTDVTFIITIQTQSDAKNLNAVLHFITREFSTNIVILEVDRQSKYKPLDNADHVKYEYIFEENPAYRIAYHRNQLFKKLQTPFVAVWDPNAIASSEQIIDVVNQLRLKQAVMAIPYDGRLYNADKILTDIFINAMEYEALLNNISRMDLTNGYYSDGGAFIVNREQYLMAGGENENTWGWEPECSELIKRMEILELPVYRAKKPLFYLWPKKNTNSKYAIAEEEINNINALLKTCHL